MPAGAPTLAAMSAPVETIEALDAAESHRRHMLAESDALLGHLEELRLAGRTLCPQDLAGAVPSLQLRLGRLPADRPRTVRAGQNLVFALQARLMELLDSRDNVIRHSLVGAGHREANDPRRHAGILGRVRIVLGDYEVVGQDVDLQI